MQKCVILKIENCHRHNATERLQKHGLTTEFSSIQENTPLPNSAKEFTNDIQCVYGLMKGHGGRVVNLSPPTSEAGVRFKALPQVGKLVVACYWSVVSNTES